MRPRNLIGPQVRKLRSRRGWTQDQLAGALQRAGWDLSRSGVAKVEARMVWVGDDQMLYFMRVLRVEFEDLLPPIDPHEPSFYENLERLMKSRF
ncbi:MAG: helix-turn-helix transcriptional regulator [Luteolibacter sp.]